MRGAVTSTLVISGLLCSWPSRARGHDGPAEAPDFGVPECITVVDVSTTPVLAIEYNLSFDDVMPEPGHIKLDDSKTHQFFAFRGQVVPYLPDYHMLPFALERDMLTLPIWLNRDDLSRAAAANTPDMAPSFQADTVGDNLLVERSDFAGLWQPIAGDTRVPITTLQSQRGLRWDLHGWPAGVYQLAAYVFSPPWNAWEPRPGVIKLVDAAHDFPAVTVDPVDASLFGGQGRKVTGCVHAPAGSELHAWSRDASQAGAPWQPWATQAIASNGHYELCYRNPSPGRSGLVQIRVAARSPSGDELVAYAPDQLALVATEAPCTASAKLCCDPAPEAGAGALPPDLGAGSAAPSSAGGGAGSAVPNAGGGAMVVPDGGAMLAPPSDAATATAAPPSAAGSVTSASSHGSAACSVQTVRHSHAKRGLGVSWLLLGVLCYCRMATRPLSRRTPRGRRCRPAD
jgi:hypothetical protein